MVEKSRRKFLAESTKLAVVAPFMVSTSSTYDKKDERFIHHVYFWLKPSLNNTEKKKFEEGIKSLTKIPTVKDFHLGVPANTNREVIDTTYSYSLLLIFNNLEDQEIYQKHPIHLKFVDECASLWARVIVYDSVNAFS